MRPSVFLLLAFACMSPGTYAADIFKWVDEKGQVHYGQTVPEKFKRSATKVDRVEPAPSEAQRQEAAARAAQEKAKAESLATERANSTKPRSDPPPLPATAATNSKENSCEAQWKKYRESEACFGPYRTANGGIRPEALQKCVAVKEPTC